MPLETQNASTTHHKVEVILDGQPVRLPSERHSLNAIRCYLETLSLERQRILCSFSVDGARINLLQPLLLPRAFARVEGETIGLDQMPLQLVETARCQVAQAREQVLAAVTLVLINDGHVAREVWWNLANELKAPLLTLSLVPETVCGPVNGRATLNQLRKWQLQQLASLIKRVDEACWSKDTNLLSNALENHVLSWLGGLEDFLQLWHETMAAGIRAGRNLA